LPVAAVALALACLIATTDTSGSASLVRPLGWSVIAVAVLRQVLMARERATALRQAHDAALEIARAEARHRRVIEQIPATLYIDERTTPDQHPSQLVFVSPQVRRLLGYDGEELRASPDRWYTLIHPDDAARVGAAEDDHFRTGDRLDQVFRMRVSDGRYVWIRDEASLLVLPDGRLQSHGVLTDITSEKDAEAQLRASEEQQRRIIETASSAYVSIDDHGVVIEWNERATQTFGWSRDEALGTSLAELIVPEASRAAHQAGIRRYLATGSGPLVGERTEVQAVDKSGRHLPVELTIWPVRVGDTTTFSALIHDITERRRLEDELRHQAFHDSLTGLANRALFSDRLGHALERRDPGTIAVVSFDLDDFKLVNDGLGHPAGDELLIQVATRLGRLLRAADTAARLGGDEFAVLIEDTDEDAAARVAERIIGAFAEPFKIHGRRVVAQASLGLALSVPGVSAEAMLRDADAAMYEAKRRGKGIWLRFDPVLSRSGIDALELRADLKTAIERHQLTLAYQPIVDLEKREIMGVEALARWTHPTRGVIPPATFIQIAEASDLITSLGTQVLRDACAAVQGWRLAPDGKPDLRLSVNLSARQLLHPTIVEDVRSVLSETGLDARALTLEITEGVVVDDAGSSLAAIEGLKALGVRIAIDDFGTGYSSLSYLSRLPIDVLKIDRSFIAELEASRPAAALVRSIIRIGQTLHLDIVAEGVETEGQCDRLRRLGARFGQGFLFSVPLDRAGIERSLGMARPRTASRTARRSSVLARR
ncbi:MAG TPA: EAL domain-containing protein, partial [Candidatus Limnocylindrales bacterium]